MKDKTIELLVCTTCKREGMDPDAPRPGAQLADALDGTLPDGVRLTRTECLSNCKRGCTVALRGEGNWTYIYGDVDPDAHADAVRDGATKYRDAPDGLVPWRERPEHFRKHCIARIPPITAALEPSA